VCVAVGVAEWVAVDVAVGVARCVAVCVAVYCNEFDSWQSCLITKCSLCVAVCVCHRYGVARVSRIDKIIGLFCRISSLL